MNLKKRLFLLPIALYFGLVSYNLFTDKQQGKATLKQYISLMPVAFSDSLIPIANKSWFLTGFCGLSGVLSISTILGIQPVLYFAAIIQSIIVWNITFGTITSGIEMQELSQALNQIAYNLVVLSFIFISLSCCGSETAYVVPVEVSSKKNKKSKEKGEEQKKKIEEQKEKADEPVVEKAPEEKKSDKKKKK